ncbi:hypothetical protein ABKW28_12820 [Nocardioides sp. 31GB23]|uniref:hypothetical protein n=1 Tax=Nocardioides sp. 31GB23 TaxID=3156065 RepID=UPI0032AEC431
MSETQAYDVTTDIGKVRLLLSDIATPWVFTDTELQAFLDMEGGVKRAAAQAIDTNATNHALASRVLRSQDVSTDGAKLADAMRAHADRLRAQADQADDDGDGFFFDVIDLEPDTGRPERTGWPV